MVADRGATVNRVQSGTLYQIQLIPSMASMTLLAPGLSVPYHEWVYSCHSWQGVCPYESGPAVPAPSILGVDSEGVAVWRPY